MTVLHELEIHFPYLFLSDSFHVTESQSGVDSDEFVIIRGRHAAFRFSFEDGQAFLAVASVYGSPWFDIRDVLAALCEDFDPLGIVDFQDLSNVLQPSIGRIEKAFSIGSLGSTQRLLSSRKERRLYRRPEIVATDTRCGALTSEDLEEFVSDQFGFLLLNNRYKVSHVGHDFTQLILKGSNLKLSFRIERGEEMILGSRLHFGTWFGLEWIRRLYESNFDNLSLQTFMQWRPVLSREIDRIELLFSKQNVSKTVKALRRMRDEYEVSLTIRSE
ncbi:MAG: hypothetical protein RBT76_11735 [candidate division Zixibacteria bacterium]|nr:hypothetical protein [candidate division Zixibacteria bacterium]